MTKEINIEEELCPDNGKLIIKDGYASTTILDEELDPIHCGFNGDDCVNINTDELSYLVLSKSNLSTLLDLIDQADEYYENEGT